MKDLYQVLKVSETATLSEIKKAYRKLAKKYHPDVNPDNQVAERIFKEITEAYEIIGDEVKRKKYDRERHLSQDQQNSDKKAAYESKGRKTDNRAKQAKSASSMGNMDFTGQFENFFGFNPHTKEAKGKQQNTNPINTDALFSSFFNPRKK